jgi:hypothetical protein
MMLVYYLEPTELTEDPNDLRARTTNVRSFGPEEIVERIMGIGAGLTRSDIHSVFEATKQVLSTILREGGSVSTELFSTSFSIQGTFTASAETDPYTVRLNLHAGKVLRDAILGLKARKVAAPAGGTIIEGVTDIKTGSLNGVLTPDRDVRITGAKVKIVGEDPGVGLFFVNTETEERTQVDPTDIVENTAGHILAVVPVLANGTYQVQIVTQYTGGSRTLKEPRTALFDKVLTVGPVTSLEPVP